VDWQHTSGPPDADIVVVGEAWGSEEAALGLPFVGESGKELTRILAEGGVDRGRCLLLNIVDTRPEHNDFSALFTTDGELVNELRPGGVVVDGLRTLYDRVWAYPRKLIIGCGNYPLWAFTDKSERATNKRNSRERRHPDIPTGITKWRGSQLYATTHNGPQRSPIAFLPILHPAGILRQWSQRQPTVHDLRMRVPRALDGDWGRPNWAFDSEPRFERIVEVVESWIAGEARWLTCDVETKAHGSVLTCIGFATSEEYALCVPFVNLQGKMLSTYWSVEQDLTIRKLLCRLFQAPHIRWIGQNFLYDCQIIRSEFGVVPALSWDTLIAQNLLLPGTPKSLDYLSALFCKHHVYWKDDNREWSDTGTLAQHLTYNCEDNVRTFEIAMRQREALASEGLLQKWEFELFKFNLAWSMWRNGIPVDRGARQRANLRLIEQMIQISEMLLRIVPPADARPPQYKPTKKESTWLTSPSQAAYLFYEVWKLPVQRDQKTKAVTTNEKALLALKSLFPRLGYLFDALLELRSLAVLHSTFVTSRLEPDGRMRGSFNPAGTATYRWSSSKNAFGRAGNMQNIPVGADSD